MSAISTWSTNAADNNMTPPDGFPEGMAPSTVNNSAREVMSQVKSWYLDAQWLNYGFTLSRISNTKFSVSSATSTAIAWYAPNRRIKITEGSKTLYGTVTEASASTTTTNVIVDFDSGVMSATLSAAAVGILTPGNPSFPKTVSGWTLINTKTASSVSSIVFANLSSDYYAYKVVFDYFHPTTDAAPFAVYVSTNNGSSAQITNYDGSRTMNGTAASTTTTGMIFVANVGNAASAKGVWGELTIYDPANTARYTTVNGQLFSVASDGAIQNSIVGAQWKDMTAVNAIILAFQTGTVAAGQCQLYGLKA